MGNKSKDNIPTSNREMRSKRNKSEGKNTLMSVIKIYMKDKSGVDKVMSKNQKLKNMVSNRSSSRSIDRTYTKVHQRTYDMVKPVSKFSSRVVGNLPSLFNTHANNNSISVINSKNTLTPNPNALSRAMFNNRLTPSYKGNRGKQLSYDGDVFNFKGSQRYLNTDGSTTAPMQRSMNDATRRFNTNNTITSLNNSQNKIVINQSQHSVSSPKNSSRMGNMKSNNNNNIINIVNNLTRKPSDVVKLKMNLYDINLMVPNDSAKEENVSNISIDLLNYEQQEQIDEQVEEHDETKMTKDGKMKTYKTINFTPKMSIDIKKNPVAKTLSLRINNINHSINLTTSNNDLSKKNTIVKSISELSSGESKYIKQNTNDRLTNKTISKAAEEEYNNNANSPLRKSTNFLKTSPMKESYKKLNKRVSLYLANNIDEIEGSDILDQSQNPKETQLNLDTQDKYQRGISMKFTTDSFFTQEFLLSKKNTEIFYSKRNTDTAAELFSEESEDETDFIREKVKAILRKVGDNLQEVDLAKNESKLYTSSFQRYVNRTNTILKSVNRRANEIKDLIPKYISKSMIVKRSNYISINNGDLIPRRAVSFKSKNNAYKINPNSLQKQIARISLAPGMGFRDKLLDMQRSLSIEFKLIGISGYRDEVLEECQNSSNHYIKSLIHNAQNQKNKAARSKKLLELYKVGLKKKILDTLFQPSEMLPVKSFTPNIENLCNITTDLSISHHLNNRYFDIYSDILLSVYKNFYNFTNDLGQKVLNADLFNNFRINNGNINRRSSRMLSLQFTRLDPHQIRNSFSINKTFLPFFGVKNNEHINTLVLKDRQDREAHEERNFIYHSEESEDSIQHYQLTHMNLKTELFEHYIRTLKSSQFGMRKKSKKFSVPKDINMTSGNEDYGRKSDRPALKYNKKKKVEIEIPLSKFKKNKSRVVKFDTLPEEQVDPDRPLLNTKECAHYLLSNRLIALQNEQSDWNDVSSCAENFNQKVTLNLHRHLT
jgi:hypothetical protein